MQDDHTHMCHAHRLLCSVVDNIEALIDEWFPGLRNATHIPGEPLVNPCTLCPYCGELVHHPPPPPPPPPPYSLPFLPLLLLLLSLIQRMILTVSP